MCQGMAFIYYDNQLRTDSYRSATFEHEANRPPVEEKFGSIHSLHFDEPISPHGYPDWGEGIYSRVLNYRDWYKLNFLKMLSQKDQGTFPAALAFTLIGGVYHPWTCMLLSGMWFGWKSSYFNMVSNTTQTIDNQDQMFDHAFSLALLGLLGYFSFFSALKMTGAVRHPLVLRKWWKKSKPFKTE